MPQDKPEDNVPITLTDDPTHIDWHALASVIERAPLGKRVPEDLCVAFLNSGARCFAWSDGRLVGCGRALTDRQRYAVVFDVAVLPEFQGQGVGRSIMEALRTACGAAVVLLYAVPGKEDFYRKLGYRRMTTAMALFPNPDAMQRYGVIE